MMGPNDRLDVSSDIEVAGDVDFVRVEKLDEVVHDDVDDVFVKNALITVLINIKFQTLELNAPLIWNILD